LGLLIAKGSTPITSRGSRSGHKPQLGAGSAMILDHAIVGARSHQHQTSKIVGVISPRGTRNQGIAATFFLACLAAMGLEGVALEEI